MKTRLLAFAALLLIAAPVHAQTSAAAAPRKTMPSANVRLTFYLIQADGFPNDDADIRSITVELRKIFKFTGYRLASKSVIQTATSDGFAEGSQVVTDPDGVMYRIEAQMMLKENAPPLLHVILRPAAGPDRSEIINASVNIESGKTVVLGSALGGKDKAIILAVTPTIER